MRLSLSHWEKVSQTFFILTWCMLIYMHVISPAPTPIIWICIHPALVCVFVTSPSCFSFVSCFFPSRSHFPSHILLLALVPVCVLSIAFSRTSELLVLSLSTYCKCSTFLQWQILEVSTLGVWYVLWAQTENTWQAANAMFLLFVPCGVLFLLTILRRTKLIYPKKHRKGHMFNCVSELHYSSK